LEMAVRRARPEDQIQRAVFEHLRVRRAPGVYAFHPANGGWRSRIEAAILKGLGVRAGVPDVIAVKNGRTYAMEIKAPGGRLTAVQNAAHAALRAAGATVVTSYSLDDAVAQLERWGLLRGQASLPANRVWEQRRQRFDPARRSLASAGVSPRHQRVRRKQGTPQPQCRE
jgi:hypothetical protein